MEQEIMSTGLPYLILQCRTVVTLEIKMRPSTNAGNFRVPSAHPTQSRVRTGV